MADGRSAPVARATSESLSQRQIDIVIALERVGASLSLIGVTLIFIIYWAFKPIRTVPNLFILFASIANIGASIACAIGYDGLRIGEASALCQVQAFLLEMFMQSDPWWSFAMAINVYLVFFAGANPSSFRQHVWVYCVICFGFPFIPAICLLLVRPDGPHDLIYGDATLWCWINSKWSALRIYTYYIPIWCCIFGSCVIYFAVGYHVFHQRNQLRNVTFSNPTKDGRDNSCGDGRDSAEKVHTLSLEAIPDDWPLVDTSQNLTTRTESYGTALTEVQVTISTPRFYSPPQAPSSAMSRNFIDQQARNQRSWRTSDELEGPPSSPRFETTCTSSPPPPEPRRSLLERVSSVKGKFSARLKSIDPIKLAYLRTSFIFAISVFVTWTPSSINRVYNLIRPGEISFGLNVASAAVLPLQGVWNAFIFFITSWSTFKKEWTEMRYRHQGRRLGSSADSHLDGRRIEVIRDERRTWHSTSHCGHTKAVGSDQTSEFELNTSPAVRNIRAMRGSFSI
ncbi:g-protein coupled receptor [Colletotrichum truncatum]|uniref:G-protein coupled receptor n=1 Tax=Colletotrichum truncatum TaxID=5467 RepID=A0ACC3Z2R3_COLTU|nr:g-protein coupled receptor [Colletotrichum truncatum]KAF6793311.1 g-protein coupled receptor [Colletotrichum truncatum]